MRCSGNSADGSTGSSSNVAGKTKRRVGVLNVPPAHGTRGVPSGQSRPPAACSDACETPWNVEVRWSIQ